MNAWLASMLPGFAGFAWPWLLWLLPLPWFLRRFSRAAPARGGASLKVPWGDRLVPIAVDGTAPTGTRWTWPLWVLWLLLCVAAARPQQYVESEPPPRHARDLMLAVDLSGSMAEEDMMLGNRVVDRLTAANAVIHDFLQRRDNDRVGLLVFGQRAYTLVPLTFDHATVREQLMATTVGIAGRETAIGDAIALAVKRLRDQATEHRVLVLLTDGVNTPGLLDPLRAAELAKSFDVRIYTIAFGAEEPSGLSIFGRRLTSGYGSDIDEATLQAIAGMTGGHMFRARDAAELAGIYAEIDRLEPVQQPVPGVSSVVERYTWPLALGVGFSALMILLQALSRLRGMYALQRFGRRAQ